MPESSWGAAAAQVAETLGIPADAIMTEDEIAEFRVTPLNDLGRSCSLIFPTGGGG